MARFHSNLGRLLVVVLGTLAVSVVTDTTSTTIISPMTTTTTNTTTSTTTTNIRANATLTTQVTPSTTATITTSSTTVTYPVPIIQSLSIRVVGATVTANVTLISLVQPATMLLEVTSMKGAVTVVTVYDSTLLDPAIDHYSMVASGSLNPGAYRFSAIGLTDSKGGSHVFGECDMNLAGMLTSFVVESAVSMVNFTEFTSNFSPNILKSTSDPVTVLFATTWQAVASPKAVLSYSFVAPTFMGPDGTVLSSVNVTEPTWSQSDSQVNGFLRFTVTLPPCSPAGTYHLLYGELRDSYGNLVSFVSDAKQVDTSFDLSSTCESSCSLQSSACQPGTYRVSTNPLICTGSCNSPIPSGTTLTFGAAMSSVLTMNSNGDIHVAATGLTQMISMTYLGLTTGLLAVSRPSAHLSRLLYFTNSSSIPTPVHLSAGNRFNTEMGHGRVLLVASDPTATNRIFAFEVGTATIYHCLLNFSSISSPSITGSCNPVYSSRLASNSCPSNTNFSSCFDDLACNMSKCSSTKFSPLLTCSSPPPIDIASSIDMVTASIPDAKGAFALVYVLTDSSVVIVDGKNNQQTLISFSSSSVTKFTWKAVRPYTASSASIASYHPFLLLSASSLACVTDTSGKFDTILTIADSRLQGDSYTSFSAFDITPDGSTLFLVVDGSTVLQAPLSPKQFCQPGFMGNATLVRSFPSSAQLGRILVSVDDGSTFTSTITSLPTSTSSSVSAYTSISSSTTSSTDALSTTPVAVTTSSSSTTSLSTEANVTQTSTAALSSTTPLSATITTLVSQPASSTTPSSSTTSLEEGPIVGNDTTTSTQDIAATVPAELTTAASTVPTGKGDPTTSQAATTATMVSTTTAIESHTAVTQTVTSTAGSDSTTTTSTAATVTTTSTTASSLNNDHTLTTISTTTTDPNMNTTTTVGTTLSPDSTTTTTAPATPATTTASNAPASTTTSAPSTTTTTTKASTSSKTTTTLTTTATTKTTTMMSTTSASSTTTVEYTPEQDFKFSFIMSPPYPLTDNVTALQAELRMYIYRNLYVAPGRIGSVTVTAASTNTPVAFILAHGSSTDDIGSATVLSNLRSLLTRFAFTFNRTSYVGIANSASAAAIASQTAEPTTTVTDNTNLGVIVVVVIFGLVAIALIVFAVAYKRYRAAKTVPLSDARTQMFSNPAFQRRGEQPRYELE